MARGTVVVNTGRCKGCGLCVAVCPQDVLSLGPSFNPHGYRYVILQDPAHRCTGCALCGMVCPDGVLTIYRERTTPPHAPNSAEAAAAPRTSAAVLP